MLIGADLVGNAPLGEAVERVMALPAAKNLPAGVEIKQFGDAEIMGEVFESFAKAMGAGIMMVYAVLVLLFGSFLQPITILFSLPLSIGGAIAALLLTGKQLTTPVWIGILMLMGIVTKNAIIGGLAIEEIRRACAHDALVDAGRSGTADSGLPRMIGHAPSASIGCRRRVSCAMRLLSSGPGSRRCSPGLCRRCSRVDVSEGEWRVFSRWRTTEEARSRSRSDQLMGPKPHPLPAPRIDKS